ncbi:ArsR/SmtB family transcription factor [Lachnoclostridium phytofermentans]|uniref:Transcriptional regulator, ArsR family n=1 Tax=Lachnoclostridium phytofermentans (strain ATCC 700394 / DSM 18823 / ISDg) TaxID=357809 RepID=A9KJD4_LACP7|nr:metalloregulator ArsR/SmtB family transcription factor [Lachnoclostridium phytofermentans]ABX42546.1 transcriptional regulator, ArsR family [Lachnoclostridium phytofermentans ISDg]
MDQESRQFKDNTYTQLAKIGKAIASPKRLEILDILAQGSKTVDSIARETEMSVANTSQHLQVLLEARLVDYQKQGLYSYYKLADKTVVNFILSLQMLAEKRIAEITRLREEIYSNKDNMEQIKMPDLLEKMKNGNVTLIDVRPKDEYEIMHIPGANSIPIEDLEKHISNLPSDQEIVAYCRGRYCLLSVEAVELLRSYGYKAVRLEESVQEWYSYNND